jgi:hypothetical protein
MNDLAGVTLLEGEIVCVNLNLGPHVLMKGYRGKFGLPVEAFTRLFAARDGRPVAEISWPDDLSRFVDEVHTLAQALAFVDLFTSPSTHFLFPAYKNVIELTVRTPDQGDRPGAITSDTLAAWGLDPAAAREATDQFAIDRNLLVRAEGHLEASRVGEEVRRDGTYAETARSTVKRLGQGDVIFPVYE